ncbi:MAG: hypothetical protein JXC31_00365 [Acholeplasmataceae bacterium]|nr:hypothetical protein [Acholeplasmataceae bacterium]
MQKQKARVFPDCSCCGERLEKKNELLPGLVQCPVCKNEHYVSQTYNQQSMIKLKEADLKRISKKFIEAYDDYEMISSEYPELIEPYWGMFLSTYGIIYEENEELKRFGPKIHMYLDEMPSQSKYFKKVIVLSQDKYKKQHFIEEGELIDKIWNETKPALKKIKKVLKKTDDESNDGSEPLETALYKKMGSSLPKDYTLDPILENKIKNAEIIYLKANKFGRANKVFDEVLEIDPYAKRALWGKLLCKLQVSDFDLLGLNIKLSVAFPLFEEVMECHKKDDENIYLQAFETYLFKLFKSSNKFDEELFDYILSWKNRYDQHQFSKVLYEEIRLYLEKDNLSDVSWIHQALAASLRFVEKENPKEYINKHIEIARDLNLNKLYKDAQKVIDIVLSLEEKNQEALIIQLCATYKVPELTLLHTELQDLKLIKAFEDLIESGYQNLDVFMEVRLAAINLVENGNYKQSLQLMDLFIEHCPEKEVDVLNDSLLEISELLIYKEKHKEAEKYVNHLIHNLPLLPAAHWCKLKIALGANTNFDVLMYSKKDLMEYPDFEHAINSTSNPEDYIKFYEIHDALKQSTKEGRTFKKMANKHYDEFEALCGLADIHTFVTDIVPELQKKVKRMAHVEQSGASNITNRTVIILILIGLAFVVSNLRALFDTGATNQGSVVADRLIAFIIPLGAPGLFGLLFIVFILTAVREGNSFLKSLLKGFLLGLLFTVIALVVIFGIPWALASYLDTLLFRLSDISALGLSSIVVAGTLFGLVIIASILILRGFHIKLVESTQSKKASRSSIINFIVVGLIVIGALAVTLLGLL